jgi:anaerobic glycerol-3-phosphate dehydrogenase
MPENIYAVQIMEVEAMVGALTFTLIKMEKKTEFRQIMREPLRVERFLAPHKAFLVENVNLDTIERIKSREIIVENLFAAGNLLVIYDDTTK